MSTSRAAARPEHARAHGDGRMYVRFALMILSSTAVMFALTYTNAFSVDHVRWSEERFYMAVLMGAAMSLVMLAFMRSMMYRNGLLNLVIVALALLLGGGSLYLSRSQALVADTAYMDGMIPHHSIAILTSERADIDVVRVRKLADGIAKTQREEIKEMEWLVDDIERHGPATTPEEAAQRPVPDFGGEAAGGFFLPSLFCDPIHSERILGRSMSCPEGSSD
jgi:hypothetical protein